MFGIGLLLLRLGVGLTVAAHGAQKLFGWYGGPGLSGFAGLLNKLNLRPASAWAWIAALAEFAGGLALALGLLTPLAGFAVLGSMVVAILLVHAAKGFWNRSGGIEFPLMIATPALALTLTGAGPYSLDSLLRINWPEPLTWFVSLVAFLLGVSFALLSRTGAGLAERPQGQAA